MMILVACEESQRVCEAFRMRGHEAYSADIQEPSGGHPEWHILGDVLPIINGSCEFDTMDGAHHHIDKPWDILIAHPPCTYLTSCGANLLFDHNHKMIDSEREKKGFEAADFFYKFLQVSLLGTKVCVENPLPLKHFQLPRYSQIIHPYYFGEPWSKRTCLWLVGLPLPHSDKHFEKPRAMDKHEGASRTLGTEPENPRQNLSRNRQGDG